MKNYPYDYTSTAEKNKFTCEFIVTSEVNSDRVLVPKLAPFYEEGLIITLPNTEEPLKRGYDYELVKPLYKIHNSVRSPAWFAIQLINSKILGKLIVTGQTVGEDFIDPTVDILDELVKYLNNPNVVYYSNIEDKPQLFPPSKSITSWDDLLNKKYIASSIEDIGKTTDINVDDMDSLLSEFKNRIAALIKTIDDFDYQSHIDSYNPHDVNLNQLNMLGKNDTAANANRLAGLSICDLANYIISKDENKTKLEDYINRWISKPVTGTFNSSNQDIITNNDNPIFSITDDKDIVITGRNGVVITAGYNFKGEEEICFRTGDNELKLVSSGDVLSMDSLTYNGYPIITSRDIYKWQVYDVDTAIPDLKIKASGVRGFVVIGSGTEESPFKFNIRYYKSSINTPGVAVLTNNINANDDDITYVLTPSALNGILTKLSTFLNNDVLLNGKTLTNILTASDIYLGNVDNTSDLDKPLTINESNQILSKAKVGHHHNWNELGYGEASSTVLGVIKKNTLEDFKNGKFVSGIGVEAGIIKLITDDVDSVSNNITDNNPGFNLAFINDITFTKIESNDTYIKYTSSQTNLYYKLNGKIVNGTLYNGYVILDRIATTNNWWHNDRLWFYTSNINKNHDAIFKDTQNDYRGVGFKIPVIIDSNDADTVKINVKGFLDYTSIKIYFNGEIYSSDDISKEFIVDVPVNVGDVNTFNIEISGNCYNFSIDISSENKTYYTTTPSNPNGVDFIILNKKYLGINNDYFIYIDITNGVLNNNYITINPSADIYTSAIYLGRIRIDGTFPETIFLPRVIDSGSYIEIEEHVSNKYSHDPKFYSDISVKYNENTTILKPLVDMGTTSYKDSTGTVFGTVNGPISFAMSSSGGVGKYVKALNIYGTVNPKACFKSVLVNRQYLLTTNILNSVFKWTVKGNPFEQYKDTYDGQIHAYCNTKEITELGISVGFEVSKSSDGSKQIKMVDFIISVEDDIIQNAYDAKMYYSADGSNVSYETSNINLSKPVNVDVLGNTDDTSVSVYYRIIPELNLLRALVVYRFNGKTTQAIHEVAIDCTEINEYSNGFAGAIFTPKDTSISDPVMDDDGFEIVDIKKITPSLVIYPTLVDSDITNEQLSKFNFISPLMYNGIINDDYKLNMDVKDINNISSDDYSVNSIGIDGIFYIAVTGNDIMTNLVNKLPWINNIGNIKYGGNYPLKAITTYRFDTPMSLSQHNLDYIKDVLKYERDILNIKFK